MRPTAVEGSAERSSSASHRDRAIRAASILALRARFLAERPHRVREGRRRDLPPIERPRRRTDIEPPRAYHVLLPVHQHIDQPVTNLARGAERPRVIPIAPHVASAPQNALDRARHANCKSTHAARKRGLVLRLDEQVHVVSLNRIVHDAKPLARSVRKSVSHSDEHALFSQARQPSRRTMVSVRKRTWQPAAAILRAGLSVFARLRRRSDRPLNL